MNPVYLRVTTKDDYLNGHGKSWTVHNVNLLNFRSVEGFEDHLKEVLNGKEPQYLELKSDYYPQSLFDFLGVGADIFDILNGGLTTGEMEVLATYYRIFGRKRREPAKQAMAAAKKAFIGRFESEKAIDRFLERQEEEDGPSLDTYRYINDEWLLFKS